MVYKLVRTDCAEPCKIPLTLGTRLIGRGKFLECEDKRISRNHGELIIKEDSLQIKALHQNPCFYMKKDTDSKEVLKQNCIAELSNGDRFGLLPESYWYEVLLCSTDIATLPPSEERGIDSVSEQETVVEQENDEANNTKDTSMLSLDLNDTNEIVDRSESPSLLPADNTRSETESYVTNISIDPQTDDNSAPNEINLKTEPNTSVNEENEDPARNIPNNQQEDIEIKPEPDIITNEEETRSPAKRRLSAEEVDSKKVKKEENIKEDLKNGCGNDVRPGPSSDQGTASTSDSNSDNRPPSPAQAPAGRERCIYGASCYRKNPDHKAQFSHPADADWGPGDKGVCPFGAACSRREPRHWSAHSHPPGTYPPYVRNRPQGMRVVQRQGNTFYINAHTVNFYEDRFQVGDSDGDSAEFDYDMSDSVDFDYEF